MTTVKLPAIYLFALGPAYAVLPDRGYAHDDDLVLYKFGRTTNLKHRMQNDTNTYAEMFRVTITMPLFAVVQGAFLAKAKVCITKHFDVIGSYVRHPMYSDLVVMTKKQFEHTKWIYQFISTKYLEQSNQSAELIIAQRLFIETEHLDAMAMVIKKHDMKMAESDALFMESERKREIMFAKNKALIMEHEILLGKPPA